MSEKIISFSRVPSFSENFRRSFVFLFFLSTSFITTLGQVNSEEANFYDNSTSDWIPTKEEATMSPEDAMKHYQNAFIPKEQLKNLISTCIGLRGHITSSDEHTICYKWDDAASLKNIGLLVEGSGDDQPDSLFYENLRKDDFQTTDKTLPELIYRPLGCLSVADFGKDYWHYENNRKRIVKNIAKEKKTWHKNKKEKFDLQYDHLDLQYCFYVVSKMELECIAPYKQTYYFNFYERYGETPACMNASWSFFWICFEDILRAGGEVTQVYGQYANSENKCYFMDVAAKLHEDRYHLNNNEIYIHLHKSPYRVFIQITASPKKG